MDGKPVKAKVETSVSYRELTSSSDTIFSFLLMTGYLKPQNDLGDDDYLLQIPNHEIRRIYPREILALIASELNYYSLGSLFDYMIEGDAYNFQAELNRYYSACVSYYDTGELFHQGFMLGLLGVLLPYYRIKSNPEAGRGRADIILTPRQDATSLPTPGIVLEIKYANFRKGSKTRDSKKRLQTLAQEALAQINTKNYTAELIRLGATPILQYGLAFGHKTAAVAMEMNTPAQ